MGFFSWKTQDSKQSICNSYSGRPTFPVYMRDDKGNVWEEENYEGYGVFGGKDFFDLVCEMNGLEVDRSKGIELIYSGKPYLSPNLNEYKTTEWKNEIPEDCPDQGFFYGDDEDDDDDYYEEE